MAAAFFPKLVFKKLVPTKGFFVTERLLSVSTINMNAYFTDKAYINGEWKSASKTFPVYDPYTGAVISNAASCCENDVKEAIAAAKTAFQTWKKKTVKERCSLLLNWHKLILENKKVLAELITAENGKPVRESLGEMMYAASFIEWLAEDARRAYGITIPTNNPQKRLMTIKQPIGVCGMITPWNFPSAMVTRKAGAAMAAGCTVVLKPSEDTPFSALALAQLSHEAGIPAGVLNVLPTSRDQVQEVGRVMCEHPDVAAISFTGSSQVGKLLLQQSASTVKRCSMELGGHAPLVVFESADIDKAVQHTMACKFRYMGQTCVSANRIYVQASVHDAFVDKLAAAMTSQLVVGNPADNKTTFGPLINANALVKVTSHVEDARSKGARIVVGGKQGAGNVYEPTLVTGVTRDMVCYSHETFGPVAPIVKFETEQELLGLVNESPYGLAGYLFSNDLAQCWRVAEQLEVGIVGINEGLVSGCEAPFGGVKQSGLGREGSKDGVAEYLETKYMCWGV